MKYCRCGCVKHQHTSTGCLTCPCSEYDESKDVAPVDEAVNHPSHYTVGKYEVIDVLHDWQLGFCEGNVVKYIARAQHKGKELEDLEKARFYLSYRIARLKEAAAAAAAAAAEKRAATFPGLLHPNPAVQKIGPAFPLEKDYDS